MNINNNSRKVRHLLTTFPGGLAMLLLVALLVSPLTATVAEPALIPASPTALTSDADRMIALRHGERMWQTSDGATHILINRGTLTSGDTSLQLYSSFDAGQSWVAMSWLENTDKYSTADGVLIGANLGLAYAATGGRILYTVLSYDSNLKTWSLVKTETVFASNDSTAINPAIAIDDLGTVWCAFVNKNNSTLDTNIKLAQRTLTETGWNDTGLIFGQTDNVSMSGERSARPVIISNGVGMIYTVHEKIFWSYRLNSWPVTAPWTGQLLFTSTPPYDTDPYGSHFSAVADGNRNLHMASVDHGRLLYFRFVSRTQTWNPARILTSDIRAAYPQITIAQGTLAIFVNAWTNAAVLQSTNGGNTFNYTNLLTYDAPPPGSALSYVNPRIETPGKSTSPIPVFQQFEDGTTQRLMFFQVPAITAP